MHRSGSSALARGLGLLGYALPKTLIKDNRSNRRGHWESQPLARLNEAYLHAAGLVWSDWRSGGLAVVPQQRSRDFEADLQAIVGDEFPSGQPAVIKDPRIARLVPWYRSAFEAQSSMRAIIPVRNPLEVIASLESRNNLSPQNGALLWLRYMLDATHDTTGLRRAFVAYERLLDHPLDAFDELTDQASLAPPVALAKASDEIAAFLNTGLRHHARTLEDVMHDDLTRGWISDSYEALLRLTKDPADAASLKTLHSIRDSFGAAQPILSYVMEQNDNSVGDLRRSEAQLSAALEVKSEQLSAIRDAVEVNKDAHSAEVARLRAELDLAQINQTDETEALRAHRDSLELELSELNAAHLTVLAEKTPALSELDALTSQNMALTQQLEDMRVKYAKLGTQSDLHLHARSETDQSALSKRDAEIERLRAELGAMKRENNEIKTSRSWRLTTPVRYGRDQLKRIIKPSPTQVVVSMSSPSEQPCKPEEAAPLPVSSPLGARDAYTPDALQKAQAKLQNSALFDADYYLQKAPDARDHPTGPIGHYLEIGEAQGFDPSPVFTARGYAHAHEKELGPDDNALLHFIDTYNGWRNLPKSAPRIDGRAPQIAVFTAIVGGYDALKEPQGTTDGVDFLVFTDGEVPEGSIWQKRPLEYVDADPVRSARYVKTHPHLFLRDYDFAIWTDANLTLVCHPSELFPPSDSLGMINSWHHPLRDCAYVEAQTCIEMGKDANDNVANYLERLDTLGLPREAGLIETSVVITDMTHPKLVPFYQSWWAEIDQGSRRDQLSLPVALLTHDVVPGYLAPPKICMRSDPRMIYENHLFADDVSDGDLDDQRSEHAIAPPGSDEGAAA